MFCGWQEHYIHSGKKQLDVWTLWWLGNSGVCAFWTWLHFRPICCLSNSQGCCTWIPGQMEAYHGRSGLVFPAASVPQCPTAFGGPSLSTIIYRLGLRHEDGYFFKMCLNAQYPRIWNERRSGASRGFEPHSLVVKARTETSEELLLQRGCSLPLAAAHTPAHKVRRGRGSLKFGSVGFQS